MTLIDLHTHSRLGSADSVILADDLVGEARRVGLDGVCITEHGHQRLPAEIVQELQHQAGMLVIAGIEATTELGHILIYGIDGYPDTMFYAGDVQKYVVERGGILVVAHPFRYMPKDWLAPPRERSTLRQAVVRHVFDVVTAVETANGWADEAEVAFCEKVAEFRRLPSTGGSDAHASGEVGACVTVFEDTIRDEADFLEALRSGRHRGEVRKAFSGVREVRFDLIM